MTMTPTPTPTPTALLEEATQARAPTPARARRLPFAAIVTLAVVLAAELGARALAPQLPRPIDWPQRVAGLMAEQMRHVAATEGPADLVFLGSSAVHNAFEPDVLAGELGLRSYNAGLQRAGIDGVDAWAREIVVPSLRPRIAVIGLTSRDLNDNGTLQRAHLEEYLRSPGRARLLGTETASMKADRLASRASYLVRYRRYLRRPADLADDVLRGSARLEPPVLLGAHGEPRDPEVDAAYRIRQWPYAHRNGELFGLSMERSLRSLRNLIASLHGAGITVVLVDMPVVERVYVPYHPRGPADLEAYRSALVSVARDADVPLLAPDHSTWDPARWSVDDLHLNRRGAARMTREIALELRRLGIA